MTAVDKLLTFIRGLLGQLFSNHNADPAFMARGVIQKQKHSQKRLKESMTELIFQRKKFEAQLVKLQNNKLNLKKDLETAAYQDRDELAIKLMEEMDLVVAEINDTQKNLDLVVEEIKTAKQVEVELASQIEKSESQLAILVSRSQSVKMREELQAQFSKIHKEISNIKPGLTGIEESILHLESRLENIQEPQAEWKNEVVKMRKDRTDHLRKSRLEQMKMQLRSKKLPGRVIIPEIVNTH